MEFVLPADFSVILACLRQVLSRLNWHANLPNYQYSSSSRWHWRRACAAKRCRRRLGIQIPRRSQLMSSLSNAMRFTQIKKLHDVPKTPTLKCVILSLFFKLLQFLHVDPSTLFAFELRNYRHKFLQRRTTWTKKWMFLKQMLQFEENTFYYMQQKCRA